MLQRNAIPALLTGIMATLAGIGLSRFAYTPLIPILIQRGWFDGADAVYLGAANLLGYLIGALSAHRLSERYAPRKVLAWCFVVIALSFICSASPAPFIWFFVWRLLAGVAGAILLVVGSSLALTSAPPASRPVVGPLVFCGIGLGALLSATVLPLLLELSLMWSWLALGTLTAIAGLVCDFNAKQLTPEVFANTSRPTGSTHRVLGYTAVLVMIAYALDAAGFIPHTVFWVDYLAREQNTGATAAATQWAVFGAGAIIGPLLAGLLVKRFGWHRSLVLGYTAKAAAIALPLFFASTLSNSLSSFVVGAMVPGLVALTSGRLAELVGAADHKRVWGYATAGFAALQALSGYAMSGLYAVLGSYYLLFAMGSGLLTAGLILVLISQRFADSASLRRT